MPPQRQKVAGCTAKLGCGCSSTSLVSLNRGDVVRLEVDNGVVSSSDYNTFVMYLVEKGINEILLMNICCKSKPVSERPRDIRRSDCSEQCYCNCNNDCCSESGGNFLFPSGSNM